MPKPLFTIATCLVLLNGVGCIGVDVIRSQRIARCEQNCAIEESLGAYIVSTRDQDRLPRKDRLLDRTNVRLKLLEPDEIHFERDVERWTYSHGRWVGIVLWLGGPIPLLLPLGRDQLDLRFRGEQLLSATSMQTLDRSYMCTLLPVLADTGGFCWAREFVSNMRFPVR